MAPSRRVGLLGAVGIGVGSMLGAGAFVVWGPASKAAGPLLLAAVAVAALVATVNALSTAQLAARYPASGGAYAYGREELRPVWGFVAGIGFVLGKSASVAAVALALGGYLWPGNAPLVATASIGASWALNSRGITRTSWGATVMAAAVSVGLAALVVAVWATAPRPPAPAAGEVWGADGSALPEVLAGAALLFFAFAGYARIATLGGEVREPARTIPRAVVISLGIVLALYLALAFSVERLLRPGQLAESTAPLADLADLASIPPAAVAVLAAAACAGSLLALTAGVGRTAMAMAEHRDLPAPLASRNQRGVPARAEAAASLVSIALVWAGGLSFALQASACTVLVYYAVSNVSAFRQRRAGRTSGLAIPAVLSLLGAGACVALSLSLEPVAVGAALGAIALATAVRAAVHRQSR